MWALKESEDKLDVTTDAKWTKSIELVMDKLGEKLHCSVWRRGRGQENQEYLGIDFMFFDKCEEDEYVLPVAIVEHENNYDKKYIEYSLWKILCVRSPVKVLICYQNNAGDIASLVQHLEDVIWQGSLMKGSDSDLLVIIGDQSTEGAWEKYYKVYECRNDKLEKIERM